MADLIDEERGFITGSEVIGAGESNDGFESASNLSRLVTARGTEDGLVLRIDGKAEWEEIIGEIESFLGSRRRFLEGGQVSVEWLERLPTKEQSQQLERYLLSEYGIEITARRKRPAFTTITTDKGQTAKKERKAGVDSPAQVLDGLSETRARSERSSLLELDEISQLHGRKGDRELDAAAVLSIDDYGERGATSMRGSIARAAKLLGEDVQYEEDANAKIFTGTLRSGQRVETPFSLIVVGDVNPGADLVAGGDIVVLGSLRGTAHAAAYDDDCQDRMILAMQMQPMQLRIGSVISRGSGEPGPYPEVARVENRRIVVEAYNPRAPHGKKFR